MTSNELLMLATGFALGAQLMAVLHLFWDRQDARRSDARARAAEAQLKADGRCQDHENCDRCDVLDPCPCCGLCYEAGQYVYPDGSVFRLGQGQPRGRV